LALSPKFGSPCEPAPLETLTIRGRALPRRSGRADAVAVGHVEADAERADVAGAGQLAGRPGRLVRIARGQQDGHALLGELTGDLEPEPLARAGDEDDGGLPREERERRVLDAAERLVYERGVHEVGMDELIDRTGLGKATVYRLYPTKDALIGAYLQRLADRILAAIDADAQRLHDDPAAAVRAIFDAVEDDVRRDGFRGCAFNNASIEFADPGHPARVAAREYRAALHERLGALARRVTPDPAAGAQLGGRLALLLDGMYVNAAHLGADGPAATGRPLVEDLLASAGGGAPGARRRASGRPRRGP